MIATLRTHSLLILKILVALAFLAAGIAKLSGAPMMVAVFDAVGLGQWFRYLTGLIEITGAVLLFVPGRQSWGAGLLVATMTGAVIAHLTVIGPSAVPALVLGLLSAVILVRHRDQIVRA